MKLGVDDGTADRHAHKGSSNTGARPSLQRWQLREQHKLNVARRVGAGTRRVGVSGTRFAMG